LQNTDLRNRRLRLDFSSNNRILILTGGSGNITVTETYSKINTDARKIPRSSN
jgi:hypothetical protein